MCQYIILYNKLLKYIIYIFNSLLDHVVDSHSINIHKKNKYCDKCLGKLEYLQENNYIDSMINYYDILAGHTKDNIINIKYKENNKNKNIIDMYGNRSNAIEVTKLNLNLLFLLAGKKFDPFKNIRYVIGIYADTKIFYNESRYNNDFDDYVIHDYNEYYYNKFNRINYVNDKNEPCNSFQPGDFNGFGFKLHFGFSNRLAAYITLYYIDSIIKKEICLRKIMKMLYHYKTSIDLISKFDYFPANINEEIILYLN